MSQSEVKSLSRDQLFATPWTVAYYAPPSMGFSRQEYWSGLPFPSPEDLPDPGIEPRSPALKADTLPPEPPGKSCTRTERLGLHFCWWYSGQGSSCQCRGHGFDPWSRRIPHATEQLSPLTTTTESRVVLDYQSPHAKITEPISLDPAHHNF